MTLSINCNIYSENDVVFPYDNYYPSYYAKTPISNHHIKDRRFVLKNTCNFHGLF